MSGTDFRPEGRFRKVWLQDAAYGAGLIALADGLRAHLTAIVPHYQALGDHDVLDALGSAIGKLPGFRWAYPLKVKRVATGRIDRTQPMLMGPLFTSTQYPWVMHEGRYREPLAQFDLGEVGALHGVDLGSGMLQLWLGPEVYDYEIRVIPKAAVTKAALTPFPQGVDQRYFEKCGFFAGEEEGWLDRENGGKSLAIVGIGKAVLTWHRYLDDDLDQLIDVLEEDHKPPLRDFVRCTGGATPHPTPHFFGTFSPIQYDEEDRPPCLLAMGSDGEMIWGDCGNAQIFYEPGRGEGEDARFSFAWSCT